MNYDVKKIMRKVILISAITLFILFIVLSLNDIKGIFETIKTAQISQLGIAFLLLLLYLILTPITLIILTKYRHCDISSRDVFLIGTTEHFFNGITPFATGGQPFQVYGYYNKGIKPKESTGILMMNFIIHMVSSNIFAIASLAFYQRYVAHIPNLVGVVIIGFAINFFILLSFLFLATSKRIRKWIRKFMVWLCKFKCIAKILEKRIPSFDEYFSGAQEAFKDLSRNKLVFIGCILIKMIVLAIYYLIPFFILTSLNVSLGIKDVAYVMLGTSFAITMVVWVPTPGGSGGIELAFRSIFITIAGVSSAVAGGGMLLWRLLTYYLLMLLGFIAYLLFEKRKKGVELND